MPLRLSLKKSETSESDSDPATLVGPPNAEDEDRAKMRARRAIRLTAIVFVALAAGQYVQSTKGAGVGNAATTTPKPPAAATGLDKTGMIDQALPVVLASAQFVRVSAGAGSSAIPPAIAVAATATDAIPPTAPAAAAPDCQPVLGLAVQPGAMLALSLTAPCHADQRVVLRHAGLSVTARTDAAGQLSTSLPAMSATGAVSVSFADGNSAEARLEVPGLAGLRRIAVEWQGGDRFALRGAEGGLDLSAVMPDAAQAPTGGWLTALGDASVGAPLLAQVYTYPADAAVPTDVAIEAAVGPDTCGREMLGQIVTSLDGTASVTDLSLAMPDCDGKTGYLVLKNLFPDMKIAASN